MAREDGGFLIKPSEKNTKRGGFRGAPPAFVQPLIVSLAGVTFVLLFLGLAFLNSRRMEATLLQVQENKASAILEGVERISKELFSYLGKVEELYDPLSSPSGLGEATTSAHEALATALIEAAGELDVLEEKGNLVSQDLGNRAKLLRLKAIAFVGENGKVLKASGPIPPEILEQAVRSMEKGEWVSLNLLPARSSRRALPFVAMRRRNGDGFLLLVLGQEELLAWRLRAAVQEAVQIGGWRKGVVYMRVLDTGGGILAEAGDVPPETAGFEAELGVASESRLRALRREIAAGRQVLEIVLPFRMDEKVLGTAHVGLDPGEMDSLLESNRIQIYLSSGMMTLLALLAVGFLYSAQNRHRSRIQEMRERLHQAERLSSLGRLAAAVAHEVRNPLNAISMAVQRVGREYAPCQEDSQKEFFRMVNVIRGEIQRINRIVEEFLGLTRKGALEVEEISAKDLLDRLLVLIKPQASSRGVHVTLWGEGQEPRVMVDRDRVMQALLNLALNAMEAMGQEGGELKLGYKAEKKQRVVLEIQDSGKGISQEEISKIFEPGYSTKGGGLGLGLHIAREIVRLHGGEIAVESQEGKGTTFFVSLPLANPV